MLIQTVLNHFRIDCSNEGEVLKFKPLSTELSVGHIVFINRIIFTVEFLQFEQKIYFDDLNKIFIWVI